MVRFNIIAFTHNSVGLDEIGKFHLEQETIVSKMQAIKSEMNLLEIMYLSTCNRVEFIIATKGDESSIVDEEFISSFLKVLNSSWDHETIVKLADRAKTWNGINAVNHIIEVASSIDSMVLGEREIITQVREAYNFSKENNLSGDIIRVVIRQTIQTAKKVYTETNIATRPVSVVSLAYHHLTNLGVANDAKFLVVGAGVTNQNMGRFLVKHGFSNFTVFNRTLSKAEKLADSLGGDAKELSQLENHKDGFDVIVSCTGASGAIITPEIYTKLIGEDSSKKIVIDLAIPSDLDQAILANNNVDHVSVEFLKTIADKNIKERKKELIKVRQIIYEAVEEFKEIFKMRQVEIKMRSIPDRVKEIRARAMNDVFSKDIEGLDDNSKEVLDKILNYMEKKYVSVPMLMAKEILTKEQN